MNYCSRCGSKVSPDAKFCPNCGKIFAEKNLDAEDNTSDKEAEAENNIQENNIQEDSIHEDSIQENNIQDDNIKQESAKEENIQEDNKYVVENNEEEENSAVVRKNTKKSKLSKIVLALIILAVVGLVSAHKIINNANSPDKVIISFQSAVTSNSTSQMKKLLSCNDGRLKINDENLKILLNYFKENPSYLQETISNLKEQKKQLKIIDKIDQSKSDDIIYLEKYKTSIFKITKYKLLVKPSFIKIHTNIKNTKVSVNNKEIYTSSSDDFTKEVGPLMPGMCVIKGSYTDKNVDINVPKEIDLIQPQEDLNQIEILQDLKYITITTDEYESSGAHLFVDGKDTGIVINGQIEYGPVTSSTNIYASVKKDGQTFKSDTVQVNDSLDICLNIQSYIDNYDYIKDLFSSFEANVYYYMEGYAENFTYAVNNGDFSYVEPYLYPGSKFYSDIQNCIMDYYDQNIYEEFGSVSITDFTYNENYTEGTITDEEVYYIDSEETVLKFVYSYKYNPEADEYQLTAIKKAE